MAEPEGKVTRRERFLAERDDQAIAHYRAAAERTLSITERNYLTAKAVRLAAEQRRRSG